MTGCAESFRVILMFREFISEHRGLADDRLVGAGRRFLSMQSVSPKIAEANPRLLLGSKRGVTGAGALNVGRRMRIDKHTTKP